MITSKILGLAHGQLGDQFIQLPLIEYIKKLNYNPIYTANINQKYKIVIPVLQEFCPYIDHYYTSSEYENFPDEKDKEFLNKENFDAVFHPMPRHKQNDWMFHRHQTAEIFGMYNLKYFDPNGYQINLISPYKTKRDKKMICFAPFAGSYSWGNAKQLTLIRAQELVNEIQKLGLKIIQIGDKNEPKLENTIKPDQNYLNTVKTNLETCLYIGTDTGMTWCMSGFQFPTIGLYSDSYYGKKYIKNIQPINPNAIYLSENNVNAIPIEQIIENIKIKLNE